MNTRAPAFIAVEGPIGVGKTSLARRLGDALQRRLLLEQPEKNPFLDRFYRTQGRVALPTQLFFLLQRANQYMALRDEEGFPPHLVADFIPEKDWLFAHLTLSAVDLRLYEMLHARLLSSQSPHPDLVIYLRASAEVLLERVRRRARPVEAHLQLDYLKRVADAYVRFFARYDASSLLVVDAASFDPVASEEQFAALLGCIGEIDEGRHDFNANPPRR